MIPQTLTEKQIGRLFVRAFTTAGLPLATLTAAQVSGGVQWRQTQAAGGNWINTNHIGVPWPVLTPSLQTDAMDPGRFIQWVDDTGKRNLFSIDVSHTHIKVGDIDAVRLSLTATNVMFAPCVHPVVPEVTLTLADIQQRLDEMRDVTLAEMRHLIDEIHAEVHE